MNRRFQKEHHTLLVWSSWPSTKIAAVVLFLITVLLKTTAKWCHRPSWPRSWRKNLKVELFSALWLLFLLGAEMTTNTSYISAAIYFHWMDTKCYTIFEEKSRGKFMIQFVKEQFILRIPRKVCLSSYMPFCFPRLINEFKISPHLVSKLNLIWYDLIKEVSF